MMTVCKACRKQEFEFDGFHFCSSCTEAGWGIAYERGLADGRVERDEVHDRLDRERLDHEVTKGYRQHAEQQLRELQELVGNETEKFAIGGAL
jgi:hypothetical protein